MKITIFSSNQPRHLNLAKQFAKISDEVFFVSEVNTVFPGQVGDFFKKSEVMQSYFQNVIESEKNIFGDIGFLPDNIKTLSIKSGDLNRLDRAQLSEALSSDVYVVFGASYIKGWLIDYRPVISAVSRQKPAAGDVFVRFQKPFPARPYAYVKPCFTYYKKNKFTNDYC